MNYRKTILVDGEAETSVTQRIVNLNLTSPISRLTVSFKGVNSTSTPLAHPAAMIKKLSIVDGSNVLTSLTGMEAEALEFYQTGKMPFNTVDYRSTVNAVAVCPISFGTKLYDETLAFDPTRFNNPQLKIDYDYTLGGSTGSSGVLSVEAELFDDKVITPNGFLMAKELNSTLLVSSSKIPLTFPSDYALRILMIQSLSAGKQPWEQFNHLKFSYNAGGKVIMDTQTSDLIKEVIAEFGEVDESILGYATTGGVNHYCASTYEATASAAAMAGTAASFNINQIYGGLVPVTPSANSQFQALIRGYCPFGAIAIPMGKLDTPSDWFDLTQVKNLELDITAGSSVGSTSYVNTVLQQLRTY
jgi:hypothetical protein